MRRIFRDAASLYRLHDDREPGPERLPDCPAHDLRSGGGGGHHDYARDLTEQLSKQTTHVVNKKKTLKNPQKQTNLNIVCVFVYVRFFLSSLCDVLCIPFVL